MKQKSYALLLPLLLFFACKSSDSRPELLGKWRGVSWTVNGKTDQYDAPSAYFEFKADQTYVAGYGQQREAGSYRLSGDKLYTTANATGKIEKMVQIARLDRDTLVMNMNRAGAAETLILVSEQ